MEAGPTLLTVAALALIDATGRVLMQRRPEGKAHGGLWEFPGGKVEAGEGPAEALVREIEEELGIAIRAADLAPVSFAASSGAGAAGDGSGARPLLLLLYACHCWQGDPAAEPGAALQWALIDELTGLAMPPLDVPLADALAVHLKNLR